MSIPIKPKNPMPKGPSKIVKKPAKPKKKYIS